jgi:hypothetical protein
MYVHGKSIAHIQAYMSKNHPVGASRM